jgi:hypothetical protein
LIGFFLTTTITPEKKQEGKEMATTMMDQMERITPTGTSWITIDERAAQLKKDLHPLRPECKTPQNPRPQAPDFYAFFCLIARP